jgi:hypothetical protein
MCKDCITLEGKFIGFFFKIIILEQSYLRNYNFSIILLRLKLGMIAIKKRRESYCSVRRLYMTSRADIKMWAKDTTDAYTIKSGSELIDNILYPLKLPLHFPLVEMIFPTKDQIIIHMVVAAWQSVYKGFPGAPSFDTYQLGNISLL